ncbi:MAG: glutathione S-transferase family protein [Pseudomonadota bacterium]
MNAPADDAPNNADTPAEKDDPATKDPSKKSYGDWMAWLFTPPPKKPAAEEEPLEPVKPPVAQTTQTEFVLHHHDPSPFAEKIRKLFQIKGVAWRSVQIPMSMPKPDLTALTGGYRGTPVLQLGADIFCDSRLIAEEIERRVPFPETLRAGPVVNFGLQHWSDEAMFDAGAALAMHEAADQLPADLLEDRQAYFTDMAFERFADDAPHFRAQLRAHAALIDKHLQDGRRFLFGDRAQWADLNAYFPIWMALAHIPSGAAIVEGLEALAGWRERMDAYEGGERTDIEASAALDMARDAEPEPIGAPQADRETGAAVGSTVAVAPMGRGSDPVVGTLATASDDRIVVTRADARIGTVAVHFPRIGYRLTPAA